MNRALTVERNDADPVEADGGEFVKSDGDDGRRHGMELIAEDHVRPGYDAGEPPEGWGLF